MERFTQSIEKSIESENWYSALTLSLTIPDICGRLSYPDLRTKSKDRYVKWFDTYLLHHYEFPSFGDNFTFMSGGDCYALRCSLLHEGRDDVTGQGARRKEVLSKFAISTTGTHRGMIGDVLVLNLQKFCTEICQGVEVWSEDYKKDNKVQAAIAELLTIHTQGFSPFPGIFVQ